MNYLMRKCYGVFILLLLSAAVSATQNYFFTGGREAGMAYAFLTLGGTWSVYHNPAGMARQNQTSLGFSYNNQYLLSTEVK